jgi:hypothetical protein
MGQDLTGKLISATYEDLVQISGSYLTDGTGSLISSLSITASDATTATSASYATSASQATNANNATSASHAIFADTAGFATDVNALYTASVVDATISFLKGGGGTFPITVNNVANAVSASYAITASYALNAAGAAAFPYTGSAIISGSLAVTGSQYGLLADSEKYQIFVKQTTNSTSPNILIGAQDPSMNGLNNLTGINNVVIGTGEFTSDIKGMRTDGNSNTLIGGWGGIINKGQYNLIIGGGVNTIQYSGSTDNNNQTQYNAIVGGHNNKVETRGSYNFLGAGTGNQIVTGSDTTPSNNALAGGQNNKVTSGDWNGILGGTGNQINQGDYAAIIGGQTNTISHPDQTGGWGAIVGGRSNVVNNHDYSVIVGGRDLYTSKDYEVVVPNLTISASATVISPVLTFADGTTQATAATSDFPYTGSAEITGSIQLTGSINILSSPDTSNTIYSNGGGLYFDTNGYTKNVKVNIGQSNTIGFNGQAATGVFGAGNTNNSQAWGFIFGEGHTINSNGYNTFIGGGNGNTISGTENSALLGGASNSLNGNQSVILGGGNHSLIDDNSAIIGGYSHTLNGAAANMRSIIAGGTSNSITADGVENSIIGGSSNTITKGKWNQIFGGSSNSIAAGAFTWGNNSIVGGFSNSMPNYLTTYGLIGGGYQNNLQGQYTAIIGGRQNAIEHGSTTEYSAILGGYLNTVKANHDRSVILGGTGLSTTKSDEVVVRNLTVSGSAVGKVAAITVASSTGSLDCSTGNFFTLGLANAADTYLDVSNIQAGQTINVKITNNATAAGTISFAPEFEFIAGTPFTATAATNAVDIITLISFDGTSLQLTGAKNFS